MPRPCFIIHDLAQGRAALTAASEVGLAPVLASAPGAAGYLGAGTWRALEELWRVEFPETRFLGLLDCADSVGDALAALRAEVTALRLDSRAETVAKIAAMAEALGATVNPETGPACDLADRRDPLAAAREHFAQERARNIEKGARPG
ncbi:MAG: hypothetical protein O3A96_07920 [Proteobacteria bacterium]|nr:hypothetical protein [Pseudomonadota bacterium]